MNLHAKVTGGSSIDGIVVGHIAHQDAVDEMLQSMAIGDDVDLVPIALVHVGGEFVFIAQRFGDDRQGPRIFLDERFESVRSEWRL